MQYLHCTKNDLRGASLIEIMIASVLGMIIVLAVSRLVLASISTYSAQFDAANMQDTARYVFNNIARSVRQAGYINYDSASSPQINLEEISASIIGLDDSTLKASSDSINSPSRSLNNASDVLAIRFVGLGHGNEIDAQLNCAGFGVPAATSTATADQDRGWSIYYVANDGRGEPNLYCKYKNKNFTAQSIAQGIESFQVLYGVDTSTPTDGFANQFLNASAINALDAGIPKSELNKNTYWKKITAIKIALLICGRKNSNVDPASEDYKLFGDDYKNLMDKGSKLTDRDFQNNQARQVRKIYSTTIQLKNASN